MSKPTIDSFVFGQASIKSNNNDTNQNSDRLGKELDSNEKPADELILVDAYWSKNGIKIRFIPHQMEQTLIVVFRYKYDDVKHDKNKAVFELRFNVPGTIYQSIEPVRITNGILSELTENKKSIKKDGKKCYYCQIGNFTSDLVKAKLS